MRVRRFARFNRSCCTTQGPQGGLTEDGETSRRAWPRSAATLRSACPATPSPRSSCSATRRRGDADPAAAPRSL